MPCSNDHATRIATESDMLLNIQRAKEEALKADSPKGLTALAQGFWFTYNKEKGRQAKTKSRNRSYCHSYHV